tara:strand:- start:220 stop:486 length:267 start_codon:yes stop_codon:yes gene_type:complete
MKIKETIFHINGNEYEIINHTENMKQNNEKYLCSFEGINKGKYFIPKFEVDLVGKNKLSSGSISIGFKKPIGYFDTREECIEFIVETN